MSMPVNLDTMPTSVTRLYFEAHITVDSAGSDKIELYTNKQAGDYETFCKGMENIGWKCSKFDHDDVDGIAGMWFCSNKAEQFETIREAVLDAVNLLTSVGYKVLRAKIENAVWDTKYGDTYHG